MGAHLVDVDGVLTFQSDKYPTCPAGKVPLSVKDPEAQLLLWRYAKLHQRLDAEFSADLETALINAGFERREEDLIGDLVGWIRAVAGLYPHLGVGSVLNRAADDIAAAWGPE